MKDTFRITQRGTGVVIVLDIEADSYADKLAIADSVEDAVNDNANYDIYSDARVTVLSAWRANHVWGATMEEAVDRLAMATDRYNRFFDPSLYNRATEGKGIEYANRLIDSAMCLCGCHLYDFSIPLADKRGWDFLSLFLGRL